MRVCLVASSRFPVAEPFMGGMEAHTHILATALRARGHDVTLFAGPGSDPALEAEQLPVATFGPSESARRDVGSSPAAWLAEHHAYLDLMLGLASGRYGRFDVIHNNCLHHLPVAMSRAVPAPMVTTLHTPPVPWLESAMVFACPSSRFVAVSSSVARAWRPVVDAEVVANGVDTGFWSAGPGGGTALWSGRIVPEKAPHLALLAARLADVPLDLAGPAHDPAYFDAAVRPLLDARHRYLGHLDAGALRRRLQAATVALVTPDWDEPFGLVAVEAMACGTPVAGFARGGLAEVVDDGSGVLVGAGDVEALAGALRAAALLDRRRVRHRAAAHFSHDRMLDRYEDVYERTIAARDAA